jgi:predicted ATPase
LPSPITSFIGRENEQNEVIKLVRKNRLVTIAGIGGIGKTRLAVEVGHQLLAEYPDGVWFVALESLFDPLLVPKTVGAVFEIRVGPYQSVVETLNHLLQQKSLLLIFDNCEHLLDACAELIQSLLAHCPNLRILTTSREVLNIEGEATYYLPSLSTPEQTASLGRADEYEAVQLFVERASLAQSDFQLTRENSQTIAEICRSVDGIPLAIELTAARVNVLKVEDISRQIQKSFAILAGDRRGTLPRHQTLQASLDWSWSLLGNAEQTFMRQLSVFAGGWTLEAAKFVCDRNPLILINILLQKSLIHVVQKPEQETRYYFHEMVRQYAYQKLLEAGEDATLHDRHLAYFVRLLEQAEPELYRSNQIIWFNNLDNELDNLRMALEWALARNVESGLRIAILPWRFWQRRNYVHEVGNRLGQLLEYYPQQDALRAQALAVHANYIFLGGNLAGGRRIAEQGLQLARAIEDLPNEALCLLFLGRILVFQGSADDGLALIKQGLAIYRKLGDKIGQATATGWLGIYQYGLAGSKQLVLEGLELHRRFGNLYDIALCMSSLAYQAIYEEDASSSAAKLEEARTHLHELGAQCDEGDVISNLGILTYRQCEYQQAHLYFEQALTLYEKAGILDWGGWWAYARMAFTLLQEGEIAKAREKFEMILQKFHQDDNVIGVVYTLEGFASLHLNQGQPERASRLIGWTDFMRDEIGSHRPPIEQADIDKWIAACLALIGENVFSDAYDDGKKMSTEEAVTYALGKS